MLSSGIYIHIPFCRKKCLYCDFFSAGSVNADWENLIDSLKREFLLRMDELTSPPDTLYIGGGTPSLIPKEYFEQLAEEIMTRYKDSIKEFTIEVNPDDVNEEMCRIWKKCGVTRISMGIQSFDDDELRKIGRRHDSAKAIEAYKILRRYFDNISIDLMFGLPGQTINSWEETIYSALRLKPQHLSAYTLMFEEKTPMTILRNTGRMSFPSDEENEEMWRRLSAILLKEGYIQYEISNYSKPGYESHHNGKYWNQSPYLGIGPSAHSYDGEKTRRSNPAELRKYLSFYSDMNGATPFYREEILTEEELREEFILTRMRTRFGINFKEYRDRFGEKALSVLKQNIRQINRNLIILNEENIRVNYDNSKENLGKKIRQS
ncbi:MAG: radical SAM family heme chaperone HemW, partial [Muribaculaceae bacterium]|nr:radical SAM family heme chaperone HemW [Muribaculaceae bacterium]